MTSIVRLCLYFFAVTGLLVGICLLQPLGLPVELDFAAVAEWEQQIEAEYRRMEELDQLAEMVRRRLTAKRQVTSELIAGRLSLREAVDHFQAMHEQEQMERGGELVPRADIVDACREVLSWAKEKLKREPAEVQARVAPGLEAEARAILSPSEP